MKKGKIYQIIDDQAIGQLKVEDSLDVATIIEANKETTLLLPLAVLDHFDRVGRIIRKSIGSNQVIDLSATGGEKKRTRSMFNPLKLFSPAMAAPLLAPVLMYKMLGAITGTTQLNKIFTRLESISSKLDRMLVRDQAETLGSLCGILETLAEIEREYQVVATFSPDMVMRLTLVDSQIKSLINTARILVEGKEAMFVASRQQKARQIATMISENQEEYRFDQAVGLMALKAKVAVGRLWLIHDLINKPAFVDSRLELIESDISQFSSLFDNDALGELRLFLEDKVAGMSGLRRFISGRRLLKEAQAAPGVTQEATSQAMERFLIVKDRDFVRFIAVGTVDGEIEK